MDAFDLAAQKLDDAIRAHRFLAECEHLAEQAYSRHLEAENDKIAAQKSYDDALAALQDAIGDASAPNVERVA